MVEKAQHAPAGEFEARCLALLDEVAGTGREIVVTRRGKPVAAAQLSRAFAGDPGDRLIAATAMTLRCPLVTKDARLRRPREVETIW